MNRLDVLRMIVSPSATHAARIDVVGHHIGAVAELPFAESTNSILSNVEVRPIRIKPTFFRCNYPLCVDVSISSRCASCED